MKNNESKQKIIKMSNERMKKKDDKRENKE